MQKSSWIIGGICVLVAFGIGYYLGHWQIQSTPSGVSNNTTQQNQSLSLQAQCASQAQNTLAIFERQMVSGYSSYGQQNHYNSSLAKCFVLISYSPNVPTGTRVDTDAKAFEYPTNIETLEDAYENSDLADCIYYGNLIGVDPVLVNSKPESSTSCLIGNNNVTYQQYKDFVSQRMALPQ